MGLVGLIDTPLHPSIHQNIYPIFLQVRNEVSGQEEDQDEGWGDIGTQREEHALLGQHWGECFLFVVLITIINILNLSLTIISQQVSKALGQS